MRVAELVSRLDEQFATCEVLVAADHDMRVIDVVPIGKHKVLIIVDTQDDDDVITLDIVGPSEDNTWQIVYSTGVIHHKPVGNPISDFLLCESIVARIYRTISTFGDHIVADTADDYINHLAQYGIPED